MKNSFKKVFFTAAVLFTAFSFTSCKNKKTNTVSVQGEDIILNIHESDSLGEDSIPMWRGEEGTIFVLFGYGFNNETFRTDAIKKLEQAYGLTENNGLIQPVIYPDDVRNRIMNMYDIVNESTVKGIILLGAPENTHYMLAKLQDEWDAVPPYSVFSFFPQDDILGQEATCDFVLDYEHASEESVNEETEQSIDTDAEKLLVRAVKYMASLPGPLPADTDLHTHVQIIAGNRKVHRYVDSETGLQSINHFVMEQNTVK